MMREAMHYSKNDNGEVKCSLCPHSCTIGQGRGGICGVRVHRNGVLETTNYGEVSSLGFDPIEKKPLYHYKPGAFIVSVGSSGCNFDCGFCQNYSISRDVPKTSSMTSEELVNLSLKMQLDGNVGIAFTYNEPSIWYEFVYDTAKLCKSSGMDVVLVTNGFINREPLEEIMPYINAMNIDLKAFSSEFYKKECKGDLNRVLETIEFAVGKCHVEIATLLIGGYNDNEEEVEELSKWLAEIDKGIPLHLSRYHPAYRFTAPPTPTQSIKRCTEIARQHLNHVYIGNVNNVDNNTYCYKCGTKLIERSEYGVKVLMKTDKCPQCEARINVIL